MATEKTESKYTDEVVQEMKASAPLDYEKCGIIADQFGLPQRGVVASAKRNGIAYNVKKRVSKAGGAIVSKPDLVDMIAGNLGLSAGSLEGLEKATKSALQAIASATVASEVDDETETAD